MTYLKMINLTLIYKLLQIDLKQTLKASHKVALNGSKTARLLYRVIIKTFKIITLNSHIKRPLMNKI